LTARGKYLAIALVPAALLALYFFVSHEPRSGKSVFHDEGCVKCHRYRGMGMGVIDLSRVTEHRSDTWIQDQIVDSRKHNPSSGMPRFGYLQEEEIEALLRFLHGEG
jgi:cbb3-type cytochrome oxidase cytochrome c subunit